MNLFLSKNWVENHLIQIKKKAGSRYSPKLNVDLPISEIFDGISRNTLFYDSIRRDFGNLSREFGLISSKYENEDIQKTYKAFCKNMKLLLDVLSRIKKYNSAVIPWEKINISAKITNEFAWKLLEKLREEKTKKEQQKTEATSGNHRSASDILGSDMHYIYEVQKYLRSFKELSSSTTAQLSNTPFLLLTGLAGTGKTHLLCDIVENRSKNTTILPTVLIFGEYLNEPNVWQQVRKQLDLNNSYSKNKILTLLDQAGKKTKTRSIFVIDALNETKPISFWKKNLKALYAEIKKYPNIALVVSIRSGFEDQIFKKRDRKYFIREEHKGFQFREWEAVSKFFKEFSLPLPEIPLLTPEFQNPLFLLLFCKAFQNRAKNNTFKKQKQVFRGHEGATYIFESFVKSVADKIASKFNLIKGRRSNGDYVIWDTIIKKVATMMVDQNNDRISQADLIEIIKSAYPKVSYNKFMQELEKNLLLIKVPRYLAKENKFKGFDYRFPFQKFSDHLISRYIFDNFRSSNRTPRQYFAKNTRVGKFIAKSWNRGIVEALFIQCPEQLKGLELIEVAPHLKNSYTAHEAFVESLIWRKPDAFKKDLKSVLQYINSDVIRRAGGNDNLLNAFLSVASIPEHPFNSNFLHKHLLKIAMPKRDSSWSIFLHSQYGRRTAVDRLIEWGWSEHDKSHIKNESIKLCSTALVWFLTTPNRFVRDKATKALVDLLTNRLSVMIELLEQFKSVDDLYISERLYAVAYGCALRNKDDAQNLHKLALWIFENVFKLRAPPTHILLRDYARGIIEVALDRKLISIKHKDILPPYGSKWSNNTPSESELRSKYYPEDYFKSKTKERGFLNIWSSVMYNSGSMGDFGRYVLNSSVENWSGRRLGKHDPIKKIIFDKFKRRLTKKQQLLLYKATNRFYGDRITHIRIITYGDKEKIEESKKEEAELKERMEKDLVIFEESLPKAKRILFDKTIKPFLDDRGGINDPLDRFDSGLAQRWVFNRVVQLGWDPKLHGEFDENVNYNRADRSENKPERIGKKYQWIALYELLARIADNFEFKDEFWSSKVGAYSGPWQLSIRNIDPSCVLGGHPEEHIKGIPDFTEYKDGVSYNAWRKRNTALLWLQTTKDLPDPKPFITLKDNNGIEWLILEGYKEYQEETPPEKEKYSIPRRRLWYIVRSYLVKKQDKQKVVNWIKKQTLRVIRMPESRHFYNIFLGEFAWAPSFLHQYIPYYHHNGWMRGDGGVKIPAKILVTDDQYLSSGSSIDCSTNESISIKLPAKEIADGMSLVQTFTDGRFYDDQGNLAVLDPTVFDDEFPKYLIIRKTSLVEYLRRNKYSIFWTISGEKNMIGGGFTGQPMGWLEVNGLYTLNNRNQLHGSIRCHFKKTRC